MKIRNPIFNIFGFIVCVFMGWKDGTADKVHVFHVISLGLIPSTVCGSPSPAMSNP